MNTEAEVEGLIRVELKDVVKEAAFWFELFDDEFATVNMPFYRRPLQAAMRFVQVGIKDVSGQTKDDYFQKPWFAEIVKQVIGWYVERYGAEALKPEQNRFSGLVLLRRTPIRLTMRETVKKIEVENETSWMIYADAMHESETVLSFFSSKPNLDALPSKDRAKLEADVGRIVSQSRRINLALHSADDLKPDGQRLRDGVWMHVENAVANIASLKPSLASVGAWELHLAVEKTFKVFLHQHGNTDMKALGHDLSKMSGASKEFGLAVSPKSLAQMPHWRAASDSRYAQKAVDIDDIVAIYDISLQLMSEIAAKIKQIVVLNNVGILLRKPDWV